MILIFGGAYQGKLDYALDNYGKLTIHECTDNTPDIDFSKDIINSFHLLVLAQIRAGLDTRLYIEEHLEALKSKVIISDDISCGIVPLDPEARLWRETTGRSLALLSKHADEVVRVFCGIGSKVKALS
jgi:adenosyl cobinamide kinase/adenosyl cobinamide phosphate guanylyltransferase